MSYELMNMRKILFILYVLFGIIPMYSNGQHAWINRDGMKSVIIYPPVCADTTVVISDYRINFVRKYSGTNIKRRIIKSSESIAEIIDLLVSLEFVEDLGYSNSNPAVVLQVDSLGNLFWQSITPPLIGQIILYRENCCNIIWLTTKGVEIDGKLYAYSDELNLYLREIIRKQMNSKR